MQPILLLETRTLPITFLTSKSLVIDTVWSQGSQVAFCYDYLDIPDQVCYGQMYQLLDTPCGDLEIYAHIGDRLVKYVFSL